MSSTASIRRGPITVAVMLATLMQVIDTTIANVALPHMQGSLGVNLDDIKWVLTSFIVASAVSTPMMGWLSDRFGRKRVLMTCIVGFATFSFTVGSSTSLTEIVIARALQGVFGAAFVPLSQAILLDSYPRQKHGTAMAIWGIGLMLGPILGPTIGGYLTEFYSWRWDFFVNVPVAVIAFLMSWTFVPETEKNPSLQFDKLGFAMLSLGIGALQFVLDRGNADNWFASQKIVIAAAIAFCGLWIYPYYAGFIKQPFVNLRLFKDRNFVLGCILIFIMGMVLLATLSLLPPFLQELMNYPVFTTGLILAPRGIGAMLAMFLVGRLITRVDPRLIITSGALLNVFALYVMSGFDLQIDPRIVVWTGFVQGLGLGQIFVPLSTVAFSTLPAQLRNGASALFNLIRNVGSSMGISIVFTLLTRHTQLNHADLAVHINKFNPMLQNALRQITLPAHKALVLLNGEINRQATMISYDDNFLLMAGLMLLMLPVLMFMRYDPHAPQSDFEGEKSTVTD